MPKVHTVLLYKMPDNQVLIIDPSNSEYTQHFVLGHNKNLIEKIAGEGVISLVAPSKIIQIYKSPNGMLPGSAANQPRDCIDIAVKLAFEITNHISGVQYNHVMNQNLAYFKRRPSAEIINELVASTFSFSEGILINSVIFLSEVAVIILLLGAILIYNPFLFLFTFLCLIPSALVLMYVSRKRLWMRLNQCRDCW